MESLQIVWFCLWGLLWVVFFITNGCDFGVGIVSGTIFKDKKEKDMVIKTIEPLWNANEVWLLLAGGVTFAAFPKLYTVMFTTFYTPLTIVLFAIIIRGVSLDFKYKFLSDRAQNFWGKLLFLSSTLLALLFGVFFGNIFNGVAINELGIFEGNFFSFLNIYSILGGVFFLSFFVLHSLLWIGLRGEDAIKEKAINRANSFWFVLALSLILFLLFAYIKTKLFDNYFNNPILFLLPTFALIFLILIKLALLKAKNIKAFIYSALFIFFAVFSKLTGLFPKMLPSTLNENYSITLINSSASFMTLKIMLIITLITIPVVIGCQAWAIRLFKD